MLTTTHPHDVSIIWNFWPFNYILWTPVVEFLNGHGLNWVMNFFNDIFLLPMILWNGFFGAFMAIPNIFLTLLKLIPDTVFGFFSDALFLFPDFLYFFWKLAPAVLASIFIVPTVITAVTLGGSLATGILILFALPFIYIAVFIGFCIAVPIIFVIAVISVIASVFNALFCGSSSSSSTS